MLNVHEDWSNSVGKIGGKVDLLVLSALNNSLSEVLRRLLEVGFGF